MKALLTFQTLRATSLILMISLLSGCFEEDGPIKIPPATTDDGGNNSSGSESGPVVNPPPVVEEPPVVTEPDPTPEPPAPTCALEEGRLAAGQISINSGESYTTSQTATLNLYKSEASEMKISLNDHCECGTWIPYSATQTLTLKANALNSVSVQYKDYDGVRTRCAAVAITHDTKAPTLKVVLSPQNTYFLGTAVNLDYEITNTEPGLAHYECRLNQNLVDCPLVNNQGHLSLSLNQTGAYKFELFAEDTLGNRGVKSVSFNMEYAQRLVQQTVDIQANKKVDILMIIDDSDSMIYEQKNMAARVSTLISKITGLDWKIAVVTTDTRASKGGDGQFLPMKGLTDKFIIDSNMDANQAQKVLGDTLQKGAGGSSSEQPIYNTFRAIERSLDGTLTNNKNRNFFRPDANIVSVVISDEDESATEFKNKPENLVAFIKQKWPNKIFGWHSIITIPGDKACLDGEGASYGNILQNLSKLTGLSSIVSSVCSSDYGAQLANIGAGVLQLNKIMELQCAAQGSVKVYRNGAAYTDPRTVQGTKLVFSNYLPEGHYELEYSCLAK